MHSLCSMPARLGSGYAWQGLMQARSNAMQAVQPPHPQPRHVLVCQSARQAQQRDALYARHARKLAQARDDVRAQHRCINVT